MIVTTKELFAHAYGKYAIGAYNINNLEQTMGLFQGNVDSKAPFIVQLSQGRALLHRTSAMLEAMIKTADEIFPEAIFAVHLDHGDRSHLHGLHQSGFYSSVMIDASHEPFEKNVEITKRVVDAAHAKGIVVEAELGQLGGVEEHVAVAEAERQADRIPIRPKEFVKPTGCDSLACAIGTTHGAFKFNGTRACASTSSTKSRSSCPASRWSCTAPPRCRRTKSPASTPPAATSRAPRAWMQTSSSAPPSSA